MVLGDEIELTFCMNLIQKYSSVKVKLSFDGFCFSNSILNYWFFPRDLISCCLIIFYRVLLWPDCLILFSKKSIRKSKICEVGIRLSKFKIRSSQNHISWSNVIKRVNNSGHSGTTIFVYIIRLSYLVAFSKKKMMPSVLQLQLVLLLENIFSKIMKKQTCMRWFFDERLNS